MAQQVQSTRNPTNRNRDGATPRDLFLGYDQGEDQPLGAYAVLAGLFGALFAAFLWVTRLMGRPVPERVKLDDLALLGVAAHKLSWVIVNSSVTSFVRAPVTELQEDEESTTQEEKPRGEGLQKALGKLLTCHFCIGMWVAAFLSYGLVLAPRVTRFFSGILTILAFSDFLHQLYKASINRA